MTNVTRSKTERVLFIAGTVAALLFGMTVASSAMHIMEGYLPLNYCIIWGAICVPFFITGLFSIKRTVTQHRKTLLLLVMMGAYVFVLSALKLSPAAAHILREPVWERFYSVRPPCA